MKPTSVQVMRNTACLLKLRRTDPARLSVLIAEKRVSRGITWLRANAPVGWHRNLFEPQEGSGSRFRAKDCFAHECVLALAFESRPDLASSDGYVHHASVLDGFPGLNEKSLRYGFEATRIYVRHPDVQISSTLLDETWERVLRNGGNFLHSTYQYGYSRVQDARRHKKAA